MLTNTQQAELRRILGYPAIGTPQMTTESVSSMLSAFRFLDPTGALERRMVSLSVDEEVMIFGAEHPAFTTYTTPPGESYTSSSTGLIVWGYVPIIRILQSDVTDARAFAAFEQADVVKFRRNELAMRRSIVKEKRQELADFLFVPLAPDFMGRSSTFRRC